MRAPRKRTERSRWVTVFTLPIPASVDPGGIARQEHERLRAVLNAFEQVGRVVRAETSKFGSAIVFKARK